MTTPDAPQGRMIERAALRPVFVAPSPMDGGFMEDRL